MFKKIDVFELEDEMFSIKKHKKANTHLTVALEFFNTYKGQKQKNKVIIRADFILSKLTIDYIYEKNIEIGDDSLIKKRDQCLRLIKTQLEKNKETRLKLLTGEIKIVIE